MNEEIPIEMTKVSWYPGHMYRAMQNLENKIKDVQLFLEVRDSRLPFSSKNYHFDTLLEKYNKEKIILFNKYDLCEKSTTDKVIEKYQSVGIKCLQVSAKQQFNLRQVLMNANVVKSSKYGTVGLWLMICGMPNVGKSAIINQIRQKAPVLNKRKSLAKRTATPCTTRTVTGFKICDQPLTFLVDSPGVMIPNITTIDQAMKLGLIGSIKDTIVIKSRMMDYLVWKFNNLKETKYYQIYGINQKPENGEDYILKLRKRYFQYSYETAYDQILTDFREGKLGKLTLDDISILN